MMDRVFKVFVDFDGTITIEDTGDAIFTRFGDTGFVQGVIKDLLNDRISARECWVKLCESVAHINKNELDDFILKLEIDETFHSFVDYCNKHGIKLYVLSDGFDYYIDLIFRREKLNHLTVFSNKLKIDERNKMIPSFPFYDSGCTSSANCKRNHIINNSGDDEFTILSETVIQINIRFNFATSFCEKRFA